MNEQNKTLAKLVLACLQAHPGVRMTVREIEKWIYANHLDWVQEKKRNSLVDKIKNGKDQEIRKQITAQMTTMRGSIEKNHGAVLVEERPLKFYYPLSGKAQNPEQKESPTTATSSNGTTLKEHDLYQPLMEWLAPEFYMVGKRIDEKKAKNNKGAGGNKWLYPDIVGMEVLSKDWDKEVQACVKEGYSDKQTRL